MIAIIGVLNVDSSMKSMNVSFRIRSREKNENLIQI